MTKKPAGLWKNLERFATPAAVLAEWQEVLGADFGNFRKFLRATDELALEYPCTNRPACGCRHEVVPLGMVAACRCEPRDCESIALEPKDVLVHALDTRKLCAAIRGVFGFEAPPDENAVIDGTRGTWPVGIYARTRSPVFLTMRLTEGEFVAELERLVGGAGEPFVLLAPTEQHKTSRVQVILQRERCAFVPLSACLALDGPGRFAITNPVTNPITAMLDRFAARLAEGSGLVKTVEKFGRDLEAVAKQNQDLRSAKARLEQMQAEGLFAFAKKIDHATLEQFFAILASGDVAKASRELGMKDSTLRSKIAGWRQRGKAYVALAEFVRWRKSIQGQAGVDFAKRLASGVERDVDQPALIRDVLEELESFNAENWEEKCEELTRLLRSTSS